jgi:hypothetical protein
MCHYHINRRTSRLGGCTMPEALATWFTRDAALTDLFRRAGEMVVTGWNIDARDTLLANVTTVMLAHPATDERISLSMWACFCSTGETAADLDNRHTCAERNDGAGPAYHTSTDTCPRPHASNHLPIFTPSALGITWVDPSVVPDAAHLLHHSEVWCVVNAAGEVAVYQMGTRERDANSLQGNRNRIIAKRFVEQYRAAGAVGVALFPHVFLPDSPSRY